MSQQIAFEVTLPTAYEQAIEKTTEAAVQSEEAATEEEGD